MPRFGGRVFESVRGCCKRVAGALSGAVKSCIILYMMPRDLWWFSNKLRILESLVLACVRAGAHVARIHD